MNKHPSQFVKPDEHKVNRFVSNSIVEWLLDNAHTKDGRKIDMNMLAIQKFDREDRVQFAQLIGYSIDGFGDLSYVNDEDYEQATKDLP